MVHCILREAVRNGVELAAVEGGVELADGGDGEALLRTGLWLWGCRVGRCVWLRERSLCGNRL